MTLNLEQLQAIESGAIWLDITPAEIELARPNPKLYSNQTGIYQAELNQLSLTKFQAWLDEREIEHRLSFSLAELPAIWDVVTGWAIEIGKTRLIVIPTDALDRDELCVPQEWVDLPNWLGDYYVAVQIDFEAGLMNIWGFASHQSLKNQGEHRHRSYSLDSGLLVSNLDILWMAADLELNERALVEPVAALPLDTALNLIQQQLSVPSPYSPRSNLAFSEWGAILNNSNLRKQLYQTRLHRAALAQAPAPNFHLIEWVRQEFANSLSHGWQRVQPSLGVTMSSDDRTTDFINCAKSIDLQIDLRQETVVLLIGVIPENSERMRVIVQVHPSAASRCLPPQLQLSYVDNSGAILKQVTARNNDNCIQLPAFTCPSGTEFNIQLTLNGDRAIERLVV